MRRLPGTTITIRWDPVNKGISTGSQEGGTLLTGRGGYWMVANEEKYGHFSQLFHSTKIHMS